MIRSAAIETLVRFSTQHIEERPAIEQAEIYEALAEVLPTDATRLNAARLAFAIRETSTLQLDFHRQLAAGLTPKS